ncbi:F-box/LRR-repeat protein 4 [Nosema granulosis]|uniref:F-box/LRR-repeat protein 4 n=1 Tax=Nosema granulosis TaxID=83296 RepID=A0A9P6H0G3_9MICR|nr:F-box/LRR-repeat protein 4 [Nosema granulosis]
MAVIKGPRSALTDFIEENNLKINPEFIKKRKAEKKEDVEPKTEQPVSVKKKRTKKIKHKMPVELINLETINRSNEDLEVEELLIDLDNIKSLSDEQLKNLSSYLSRNRIYNEEYVHKIIQLCSDRLVIYDCSEIKDEIYHKIDKNLKTLELYQCGQLTSKTLNLILSKQQSLEVLRVTGGYLLTDILLPPTLKVLDLTHCSRLDDDIIDEINRKCKLLEELRLSFCYKITGSINLEVPVKRLYLCETNISEEFVFNIPKISQISALSVKRCQRINNLPLKFKKLEYLDVEGITELNSLCLTKTMKILNCKQCFKLTESLPGLLKKTVNMEELNISYLPVDQAILSGLKKLKILDISWCPQVDDNFVVALLDKLALKKIFVFGCFKLSPNISESSWKDSDSTKILGNPGETKYLILND